MSPAVVVPLLCDSVVGLHFPQRRRNRRLTGIGIQVGAMSPIRPNVIDESTREALAIETERSIDAGDVVVVLYGPRRPTRCPVYVRFDNGAEFVAHAIAD